MNKNLRILFLFLLIIAFVSCERDVENIPMDRGLNFQPLEIGLFWTYEVDQTIYFGENDFEDDFFYRKDRIRTFYINEEGEQVFIVEQSRSQDQVSWLKELEYTLLIRENSLVRTINNQTLIPLVFPPSQGRTWVGNIYQNANEDIFEIDQVGNSSDLTGEPGATVRILQEESDDEVTFRDIRYETYQEGIGLIEKYDEVLTYCSRNDCLGDQLIDSGNITHLRYIEYGRD